MQVYTRPYVCWWYATLPPWTLGVGNEVGGMHLGWWYATLPPWTLGVGNEVGGTEAKGGRHREAGPKTWVPTRAGAAAKTKRCAWGEGMNPPQHVV